MSICLLLRLEEWEESFWGYFSGTDYLLASRLKGKQTKAMIWAVLKEQSWESFKLWLQRQGGTWLWLSAGDQCCVPWERHREHCLEFLLFLLIFQTCKINCSLLLSAAIFILLLCSSRDWMGFTN